MKCVVLGNGLIGNAAAKMLEANGHQVIAYDQNKSRSECSPMELLDKHVPEADYVFSVVPTDPGKKGLKIAALEDTAKIFEHYAKDTAVFVQRCTTLPGQARQLAKRLGIEDRYVVFPSFAYRNSAVENEINPPKVVLGGKNLAMLEQMVQDLFSQLEDRTYYGTFEDAEASKVYSNLWQGVILAVWNDLKYAAPDVDVNFVMETLIQEKNLSCLKRFIGKAWGKGGRLDDDMLGWVRNKQELSPIIVAAYEKNSQVRHDVGEENRPTSELKKLAFEGRVSPTLVGCKK